MHVYYVEETKYSYKFLIRKPERKGIFVRAMNRYTGNNKLDLKETACVVMDCILEVQNSNRLLSPMNIVMNLWRSEKVNIFFTS